MNWKQRKRKVDREFADGQQAITRCVCGWYFKGFIRDGRVAFKAHRKRCERAAA